MEISDTYRSYGPLPVNNRNSLQMKEILLTAGIMAGIVLGGIVFLRIHPFRSLGGLVWMLILFVGGICALTAYAGRAKDCSFTANDVCVTFTRKYTKDITIRYMDIDTIAVSAERKSGNGRSRSCYVETIVITTFDGQDYIFRAIMDIRPNGRLEATGFMEQMLKMGKFSVLKKFIETQMRQWKQAPL